jgi:hypothetical protein
VGMDLVWGYPGALNDKRTARHAVGRVVQLPVVRSTSSSQYQRHGLNFM